MSERTDLARGRFLNAFIGLEGLLDWVVGSYFVGPTFDERYRVLERAVFDNMTFARKIDVLSTILGEVGVEKDVIGDLRDLGRFRNTLAHHTVSEDSDPPGAMVFVARGRGVRVSDEDLDDRLEDVERVMGKLFELWTILGEHAGRVIDRSRRHRREFEEIASRDGLLEDQE